MLEKQIEKKVQQEARESAEKLMREQINGYSSVSVKNADFRALKEKWSYTLLPVWTITYKAKKRKNLLFFHERTDWKGVRRTPDRL